MIVSSILLTLSTVDLAIKSILFAKKKKLLIKVKVITDLDQMQIKTHLLLNNTEYSSRWDSEMQFY